MQQVDIKRLFSILAEYQMMDPDVADKLLIRILGRIAELRKKHIEQYDTDERENKTL